MKILNISSIDFAKFSGPATSTTSLSKALYNNQNISHLLHLNISNTNHTSSIFEIYNTKSIYKAIKLIRQYDIIILNSHYIPEYLIIALWSKILKKPYYIIPRGSLTKKSQHIKPVKKKIGNTIFNYLIKFSTGIIYLTSNEKKMSFYSHRNTIIIPNGIDSSNCNIIRKQKKEKVVLTYIGRIDVYHKGLDILLKSLTLLDEKHLKQLKVNIHGPDVSNSKFKLLKLLKPGLPVEIFPAIRGAEKIEALKNSTFFIQTSRFEGLPMGILEALSIGLPVIASEGTNLSYKINDYSAGIGVKNSAKEISCAIMQAIDISYKDYLSMSRGALELASNYNWDVVATKFTDFFSKKN